MGEQFDEAHKRDRTNSLAKAYDLPRSGLNICVPP